MEMKRNVLLIILCLIFAAVAVFSGYQIVSALLEYKAGEDTYSDLQQYVDIREEDPTALQTETTDSAEQSGDSQNPVETAPTVKKSPGIKVNFDLLLDVNSDVVGWLYLKDSKVSFPVVQGKDNAEYLYWLINGEYNGAGTPFMDFRNSPDYSDRNTIIYGHNMNNGTMFADIHKYTDQAYYDSHPVIQLLTPNGDYELEIFAGYITGLDADAWQLEFASDEEFEDCLERARDKSAFVSPVIPTAQDRIVTLSTCSSSYLETRFVLLGVIR